MDPLKYLKLEYQPYGEGVTRSPPATPHCLKIQNGRKFVYSLVFERSKLLSLNKFFDPSTPSMRKGRDRGKTGKKKGKKREKTDDYSGH